MTLKTRNREVAKGSRKISFGIFIRTKATNVPYKNDSESIFRGLLSRTKTRMEQIKTVGLIVFMTDEMKGGLLTVRVLGA